MECICCNKPITQKQYDKGKDHEGIIGYRVITIKGIRHYMEIKNGSPKAQDNGKSIKV